MPLTSFRAVRWLRTFNLVLQAVLLLTLVGGLNYVAKNHAWRFDLTKQRKYSLSPETLSYLKNLQRPVNLYVTLGEDNENQELSGLLHEFRYATENREVGRITTERLDIYQNRRRAEELGIESSDLILLVSGDKRRAIRIDELYTMKDGKRDAFQGEQVLTAGILDVSSAARLKIYFLVGHAEMRITDPDASRGLTTVRNELKARNFEVEEIDLTVLRKTPEDAALLVAVAPQSKYSKNEQEMLRQYLSTNAGRMVLFLEPGMSTAALGLDDLLLDWGVLVHDDLIWDTGPENIAENNDLLLYAFAPHPITKVLLDHRWKLRLGLARTVLPDPGRSAGSGLNTVALIATSTTAWGERDYRHGEFKYTPGVDTRPIPGLEPENQLSVAVASERLAVRDNLPFSVRGGKLVVFGTGDMIANRRLDNSTLAVFLNAVNWSVDRDRHLSIPPRPLERFQLTISAADFTRLRYALLLGLPGAALGLGLIVYWTRRT